MSSKRRSGVKEGTAEEKLDKEAKSKASATVSASLDLSVTKSSSSQPLIAAGADEGRDGEGKKEEETDVDQKLLNPNSKMLEKKKKALSDLRKSISLSVSPSAEKRKKKDSSGNGGGGGDGRFDECMDEDALSNIPPEEFTKLLHFTVWPCNKFDHFRSMLEKRPAELHGRFGLQQETLMHRACRYGNFRAFLHLLESGAVLTCRNRSGATPLHLACQFNRINMIKALVDAGVPLEDVDEKGDQAIHYSAKAGSEEAIQFLLDKGVYKCAPGHRRNTVLHYASLSGCLHLVRSLLQDGCDPNHVNGLTETPMHLLCKNYQIAHNHGIDVAKVLLGGGADLNARTVWGDTAAHYCGRWGPHELLEFMLDRGIEVHKSKEVCIHPNFFARLSVTPEEQEDFEMSLLQKVARSTCIVKANMVIERIMRARNKLATNMYYGNRGIDIGLSFEMNNQELSFLAMSREMIVDDDSDIARAENAVAEVHNVKNDGSEKSTSAIELFLKYSPDSLKRLFDLCICKPCLEQVQGKVYFDFFLFDPHSSNRSASELRLINLLINSGKERLLIHPIFETFLKLKWYRCWYFYLLYVIVDLVFLISLGGFTLAHFGQLYEGQGNWEYGTRNGWWWFLAITHVYSTGFTAARLCQMCSYMKNYCVRNRMSDMKRTNMCDRTFECVLFTLKNLITPILIGITLYGSIEDAHARYYLSFALILSCYHFMTVISRMPRIGLYVNMLSKVMMTVLNFFASYVWHFLGYAIAFHVLLPGSGPFALFTDSFIKVMTMLMGEYDYNVNFVQNPNTSYVAKAVFAVFVIDMSVVLMNLVLGLAVSDIEELRRNSAVRRMMQETSGVDFMENLFQVLSVMPGCGALFSARITNNKSTNFEDVVYLDLVDLDKSPNNCIVLERQDPGGGLHQDCYSCPHHIVQKVATIIKEEIGIRRRGPDFGATLMDITSIRENQVKILDSMTSLEKRLERLLGEDGDEEQRKHPLLLREKAVD